MVVNEAIIFFFRQDDDEIYFQSRQLKANDEYVKRKVKKYTYVPMRPVSSTD